MIYVFVHISIKKDVHVHMYIDMCTLIHRYASIHIYRYTYIIWSTSAPLFVLPSAVLGGDQLHGRFR